LGKCQEKQADGLPRPSVSELSKYTADDKFYSSLGSLLSGLVEHFVRHRMSGVGTILDLKACVWELEDGISSALDLYRDACLRVGQERPIRPNDARGKF